MINLKDSIFGDPFGAATTYEEWMALAITADEQAGRNRWRTKDETHLYNYRSIRHRLKKLERLRQQGCDTELLFTLNEGLHGNMDGIGHPSLYKKAKSGTKRLIDQYIAEVLTSLDHIADSRDRSIGRAEKLDFFDRAAHCYGSTALMLSGAGALGYFHLGVAQALFAEGLLPSVISGSSAGSLMAAVIGTRTDVELQELFGGGNLENYLTAQDALLGEIDWRKSRRLSTKQVSELFDLWVPDMTFQEAFEKSGRHINITVSATRTYQKSRLLNAITSPNVLVRSAVQASCAVPGFYPPVTLMSRDLHGERVKYLPKEQWADGSLASDIPLRRLSRLYGVNHYVVSQVNPIVIWSLLDWRSREGIIPSLLDVGMKMQKEWVHFLRASTARVLRSQPEMAYFVDSIFSVAAQEYGGDINIVPRFSFFDPRKILNRLREDERNKLIDEGRRSTWPKIEMIRNASAIGSKLNQILADYSHEARKTNKGKSKKKRRSSRPKKALVRASA